MTFIKSLKRKRKEKGQAPLQIPKKLLLQHRFVTGQAALEYFILSAVMAGVVWWAFLGDFKLGGTRDEEGAPLRRIEWVVQDKEDGFFQTAIGVNGLNVANDWGE